MRSNYRTVLLILSLAMLLSLGPAAPSAVAGIFGGFADYDGACTMSGGGGGWSTSGEINLLERSGDLFVIRVRVPVGREGDSAGPSQEPEGLRPGMIGHPVRTLNRDLAALGYSTSPESLYYGYRTTRAVAEFQRDHGLPSTGRATPETLRAIAAPREAPQPQPQPEPRPQPSPGTTWLTQQEGRMLDLVNRERAKAGVAALQPHRTLTELARRKSRDMIDLGYFSHMSPTYGLPFDMMRRAGLSYRSAGENLAGAPTVDRAHAALMQSPGHRGNILSPAFTHVGIGIIAGGPYGLMVTQMFCGF